MSDMQTLENQQRTANEEIETIAKELAVSIQTIEKGKQEYLRAMLNYAICNEKVRKKFDFYFNGAVLLLCVVVSLILLIVGLLYMLCFIILAGIIFIVSTLREKQEKINSEGRGREFFQNYNNTIIRFELQNPN